MNLVQNIYVGVGKLYMCYTNGRAPSPSLKKKKTLYWMIVNFIPSDYLEVQPGITTVGGTIDCCSYLKAHTPRITDDMLNIPITPH